MRIDSGVQLNQFRLDASMMKRPHRDFEKLKAEINSRYAAMSPRLQQIARFALAHPNEIALQNISMISSRLGVAPSSMIRFAKALDYRGFSDMQAVFRVPLSEESPNGGGDVGEQHPASSCDNGIHPAAELLLELLDASVASLKALLREVPPERLDPAVHALCEKLRTVTELESLGAPETRRNR